MLYIHFDDKHKLFEQFPHMIFNTTLYFKNTFRPEWLSSDLAKEIVLDVDKSVVESPYCIMSPIFGQIAPERLSGGVHALLLMLQDTKELMVWATNCGDNCAKWILKIAEKKDLHIGLSHYMRFGDPDEPMEAILVNTRREIHNTRDYFHAIAEIW